ncbi:coiled-coil domain-containing protein 60 isoform X2 [Pseudophryne corroboree]|uniref:coiled-coil domain-containing protein 60 isoform X2 n=1 Tax=Pseudophryne corroboree TaxID=495146 RepID=UPI0030813FCA
MPGNSGDCEPRSYVVIKPLPITSQKGLKIQSRSPNHYNCWVPCREEVFRANYFRRQRQLAQQGYSSPNYKPYQELGHPLFLEAKKLILHSLGQDDQDSEPKEPVFEAKTPEETGSKTSPKPPLDKTLPPCGSSVYLRHRKKYTSNFNKEFNHTRKLISSVKQGRDYFHILHQEEEAKKIEAQEKLFQEKRRAEPQPFQDSSEDSSGDDEEMTESDIKTRFFVTELAEQPKKEKRAVSRPFTPIHNSLFSEQLLDADPDPGGSKTSLKRINKEKDVEVKWERFITPGKSKRQSQKFLRSHIQRARRLSFLSTSRYSGVSLAITPTIGSVSSLLQSSDEMTPWGTTPSDALQDGGEDMESTIYSSSHSPGKLSKEDDEEPLSDYLQILLQMIAESVNKDLDEEESRCKYKFRSDSSQAQIREPLINEDRGSNKSITQRPKSSPASALSPTSLFIRQKMNLCSEMREKFFEVADEADVYLHDKVEALERRRQELNTQKYRSLGTITNFRQDLEKIRKAYHHVKEDKVYTDTNNWFAVLLSRIPPVMKNNQKIHNILEKLEDLEEKQFVRIRPNAFLRVLGGLRSWELCSPDISVAIEFVRDHIVQMPLEDYITWLQAQLAPSLSQRVQSAPPQR